jgi:hypothetical protein
MGYIGSWSGVGVPLGQSGVCWSGYWSQNSSLDWSWSVAGPIRDVLEWYLMGYSCYWSKNGLLE